MRRSFLLFGSDNRPTEAFAAFLRDVQVPGNDLASTDTALQARFFQKDTETGLPLERWELKEVEVSCPLDHFRQHLAACGFLNETKPSAKHYTCAVWPGALVTRAVARLADLVGAWNSGVRWQEIVVLGGKRPLQQDKESYEQCCRALNSPIEDMSTRSFWENLNPQTELAMMRFLWSGFEKWHPKFGSELKTVTFVDAPMKPPAKEGGPPVRPSTEDTVREWLWTNPKPGSVLLSSGAPYSMAQDEAFWTLLEPHGFTVETFGHAAPDLPIENFMREVAGCVNRIRKARLGS